MSPKDFGLERPGSNHDSLCWRDDAFFPLPDEVLIAIFSIRIVGAFDFELEGFFFQKDMCLVNVRGRDCSIRQVSSKVAT